MGKRLRWWELGGFAFTAACGTLLHFLYEWSGGNRVVAAFSPVNESTWEHMKMLVFPAILFSLVQFLIHGRGYSNFFAVRGLSILAGTLLIPVSYYTYSGIAGRDFLLADIAIFLLADAALFLLDARLLRRGALDTGALQLLGVLILWALIFVFVWCTFHPPEIPLWRDSVTGGYGLPA